MGKSLVMFDTENIKEYVFGTDKLREIRGASSVLDGLNRYGMYGVAEEIGLQVENVYTNGGDGLFLIDSDKAQEYGRHVQYEYREKTGGGASVAFVEQKLPEHIKMVEDAKDIPEYLESMRWQLREKKLTPQDTISLPSHPFMRPCDSCGVFYAAPDEGRVIRDAGELQELYCTGCQRKRQRDDKVKTHIEQRVKPKKRSDDESNDIDDYLWDEVIGRLGEMQYDLSRNPQRPQDFNVFRTFKDGKEYFALIYADANGMGKAFGSCNGLPEYQKLAETIDNAIYQAVCSAITQHLKVSDHVKPNDTPVFPFDILLMGGDDVLTVVPAIVALDVALTIATEFRQAVQTAYPNDSTKHATLSVGIVLAPVNYPFGPLLDLVESTLKFAKKASAKARANATNPEQFDDTRINFMTVTGSTSQDFDRVYRSLSRRTKQEGPPEKVEEYYATLRPYDPVSLSTLLALIREGYGMGLGRTKLHQLREAVFKMNLTTSVVDGLALLRNWREKQRDYVLKQVYTFRGHYQVPRYDPQDPSTFFYRVTFPWFADGKDTYRTSLLDFVELYDFVAGKDEQDAAKD